MYYSVPSHQKRGYRSRAACRYPTFLAPGTSLGRNSAMEFECTIVTICDICGVHVVVHGFVTRIPLCQTDLAFT